MVTYLDFSMSVKVTTDLLSSAIHTSCKEEFVYCFRQSLSTVYCLTISVKCHITSLYCLKKFRITSSNLGIITSAQ